MNIFLKKMILGAMLAVLVVAALPVTHVFAQDENPPLRQVTNEQLEKAWAHQLKLYENLGRVFEDTNNQFPKAQELIDKASANGRDVSAVQSALDAFSAAVQTSRPIYTSLKGLVTVHAGFDASGKVTDAEQAKATLQEVRAKLQELKTSMGGTGKALREAVKAFRQANSPALPSSERGD